MADFIQPYLLEKIRDFESQKGDLITQEWRLQTPNCFEGHCPMEFSYYNRGDLPKTLYENPILFNKIESHLELLYKNKIFFEEGKINSNGLFNVTVLEGSFSFITQNLDTIDNIEFASCYEPSYFIEDNADRVFKREWDLKRTIIISKIGNVSITGDGFNLEKGSDLFKEWHKSFTQYDLKPNLIQPVNIYRKIKINWSGNMGYVVRLSHFYTKDGKEIKDEL